MSTGPGDLDLDRLPPEYRAAFEAQRTRIDAISERNRRLEHLVREFRQALYGKKSEKLDADERQLAFEDLEMAVLEMAVAEAEAATPSAPSRARPAAAAKRNLGRLPKELPRSEVVIEPDSRLCPCGCGEMVKIGEDRSERLDIVPAQFQVVATVRPPHACPACQAGIVQAPAHPWLIEGGLPTEGAIAHVPVTKYADHAPLYRQSRSCAGRRHCRSDQWRCNGDPRPLHAGRLGRQGGVPPGARGRPAGRPSRGFRQALHGRDAGAGARPRARQDEERLSLGAGARR